MAKQVQNTKVYDSNVIREVCGIFSYLTTDTYLRKNPLSATASIKRIAGIYNLKISEAKNILYGRQISTGILNDELKTNLVNDYKAGISVRQLAKDYTAKYGKKVSTAHLYKVLHEMENRGAEFSLRGGLNLESKIAKVNKKSTVWQTAKKAAAEVAVGILLYSSAHAKQVVGSYTISKPDFSQSATQNAGTNKPLLLPTPNPNPLQETTQQTRSIYPNPMISKQPIEPMVTEQSYRVIEQEEGLTQLVLAPVTAQAVPVPAENAIDSQLWKMKVHRDGEPVSIEEVLTPTEKGDVWLIKGRETELLHF